MATYDSTNNVEQIGRASQGEALPKRPTFERHSRTADRPVFALVAAVVIVSQLAWLWLLFVGLSYLFNLG